MSDSVGITLYDYWRSSASYRVRIALNIKALRYTRKSIHLVRGGGEQHSSVYRQINPQESVPVLVDGKRIIRQSLAIIDYLEESRVDTTPLLPVNPRDRARVRALALLVACDIHPLNNLRVMQWLEREYRIDQEGREEWSRHWMAEGFRAYETLLADDVATGACCHGDVPTLADICLIPQVYNAHRFKVDMTPYPSIERINSHCLSLPAFDSARPENQPDAPAT